MTNPNQPTVGPAMYPADRNLGVPSAERTTVDLSRAVVISLPSRTDRRETFATNWSGYKLGYSFFDAIEDVDNAPDATFESHMQSLSSFYYGPILVLEDDAVPAEDFTKILEDVPADWELLFLGGQHFADPVGIVSYKWEIPTRMMRTHAYVVRNPQSLVTIARALIPQRQADPYISQLPVPVYSLIKFTVGQDAGLSDITGAVREAPMFWNRNPQ